MKINLKILKKDAGTDGEAAGRVGVESWHADCERGYPLVYA